MTTLIVTGTNRGKCLTLTGEVSLAGWARLAHRMQRRLGTGWTLVSARVSPWQYIETRTGLGDYLARELRDYAGVVAYTLRSILGAPNYKGLERW